MKEYKMTEALNGISDELLLEAAQMTKKRSNPAGKLLRVAAIAAAVAILITAVALWPKGEGAGSQLEVPTVSTMPTTQLPTEPTQKEIVATAGVLKLYACESKDLDSLCLEEYQLIEGMEPSYKTMWSPVLNLISAGITLTLVVNEESLSMHKITYDLSVNYGELTDSIYNIKNETGSDGKQVWGKTHIAVNGETVRWSGDELYFDRPQGMSFEEYYAGLESVHLDIIIKADGNIVGYAVVEMICTDVKLCIFQAALVDSGYFPKQDGAFQNVTEEYVRELIEERITNQVL